MEHSLREIRRSYGLTMADLSDLSDISVTAIQRIESGDTTFKVNYATADALAGALYLEVSDLFAACELSHLGRPPHTGVALRPLQSVKPTETQCGHCFVIVRRREVCTNCERPLQQAG